VNLVVSFIRIIQALALFAAGCLFTISIYFFSLASTMGIEKTDLKHKLVAEESPDAIYDPIIKLADTDNKPFCSGYVADQHYIVTAAHCLRGILNFNLKIDKIHILNTKGEKIGEGYAGAINQRLDWGVVTGDFSKFQILQSEFYVDGFAHGSGVYIACGFPYGQNKMDCEYYKDPSPRGFIYYGYAHLTPSMSGGPVLDEVTQKVIAVMTGANEYGAIVTPLTGLLGAFEIEPELESEE